MVFPLPASVFFAVYGPWGRPDMSPYLFTETILKGNSIKVFNSGIMERDFTYIDDIVEGVVRILENAPIERKSTSKLYKIYNIGNNRSIKLLKKI